MKMDDKTRALVTPEKKAEYRKLAEEVMEPVLTVAARRLGQAVEEIHTSQIKPLRDEIERLRAVLREIVDSSNDPRAVREARAALGGKP